MIQQRNTQSYNSIISQNQQMRNIPRSSNNILSASSSNVNIPATVFSRSPNKDRQFRKTYQYNSIVSMQPKRHQPLNQIPFGINTPNRYSRNSPSPLGNRQTSNISTKKSRPSLAQAISTKESYFLNPIIQNAGTPAQNLKITNQYRSQKIVIKQCQNHMGKTAKYYVESEQETLYYCEKCAISLASQGFKVFKFSFNDSQALSDSFQNVDRKRQRQQQQQQRIQSRNKLRKQQINQFLLSLQQASIQMKNKNSYFRKIIQQTRNCHDQCLGQVERFYDHFFNVLNEHKNAVVSSLKFDFENKVTSIEQFVSQHLQNHISKAFSMKTDIQLSLQTVIPQAQPSQYEAVINLYKEELKKFRKIGSVSFDQVCKYQLTQNNVIKLLKVNFQDPSQLITSFDEQLDRYVSVQSQNKIISINLSGKVDFGKSLLSNGSISRKERLHTSHSRQQQVIEQVDQEHNPQTAKTSAIYEMNNRDSQLTDSQEQLARNMRPSKFTNFAKMLQSKIDGIAIGQSRVIQQDQQKERNNNQEAEPQQISMKNQQSKNKYQMSSFEVNPTLKQLGHLFSSFESYE